jgi:DNA-binding CsgD family transcriptional regulator
MQLDRSAVPTTARPTRVRDRVLGDDAGTQDDALIFAASSVINEVANPEYDGGLVVREVVTEQGRYLLKGSRVYSNDSLQPVVLVYAETVSVSLIPDHVVRQRYGLTRKEARVAQLLAAQKSNQDIARELFISPHTARHHTQSVLGKMGVRSRREVALRLQTP